MTIKTLFKTVVVTSAFFGLSACVQPGFRADVARFQQMPAPQGQTFVVTSADPNLANSLEFAQYANEVRAEMTRQGYVPANGTSADLVVKMAYGVDNGRERVRRTANFYDPFFYDPWYYRTYRHRLSYGGYYHPRVFRTRYGYRYVHGFYDPFLFGPSYSGFDNVRAYTVYTSDLKLQIERAGTGERVFEGTAMAQSRDNDLTYLVPNLVDAMFTDFPGGNGEKVRITLPPREKR